MEKTVQNILHFDLICDIINNLVENKEDINKTFEKDSLKYSITSEFKFNCLNQLTIEVGKEKVDKKLQIMLYFDPLQDNKIYDIRILFYKKGYDCIRMMKKDASLEKAVGHVNLQDFNLSGYGALDFFTVEQTHYALDYHNTNYIVSNDFHIFNSRYSYLIEKPFITDLGEGIVFEIIDSHRLKPLNRHAFQQSIYSRLPDCGIMGWDFCDEYERVSTIYNYINISDRIINDCLEVSYSEEELKSFLQILKDSKKKVSKMESNVKIKRKNEV